MAIDVGTGDGRAVLALAAQDPEVLAISLDANASAMAETSRRAARPLQRGGLPNALFAVATAEQPPAELRGLATTVTVTLPWGSLLRGCHGLDQAVAAGIRSLVAVGGGLELVLAPDARDHLPGVPTEVPDVIAAARETFEALGLAFVDGRVASEVEIRGTRSSWARRLVRDGGARQVVLVRFASP